MNSLIDIPNNSDFSMYNIPFGIFSTASDAQKRLATRIGDTVVDLDKLHSAGLFKGIDIPREVCQQDYMNDFMALGKDITSAVRLRIQEVLSDMSSSLKDISGAYYSINDVTMHLPVRVGDYTDFYSSIEHATNLGKLFRDPENALMPNWRHIPVGYHGRASSIIESGVDFHRPCGQTKPNPDQPPIYGPSKRLDIELETAYIIGKDSTLGTPLTTDNAEEYIFGMCLFNDWSARDIQKWEYIPLGPFLGKNFASSISPWIVTLEALDYFRVDGPKQEPEVLDYLKYEGVRNIDVKLGVDLIPAGNTKATRVSNSNFKYMYWNMSQQLAHHTVNGCNVRVGDMMASGTISGKDEHSFGSLIEMTWGGKKPFTLDTGEQRTFLEDGDTVVITGYCEKDGRRVGFGEVRTTILPALER